MDGDRFVKIPHPIFVRRDLTPAAKMVYAALGEAMTLRGSKAKGYAYPGVKWLADKTGLHESTVRKSVAGLEGAKLLEVDRERGRENHYRFPATGGAEVIPLDRDLHRRVRDTRDDAMFAAIVATCEIDGDALTRSQEEEINRTVSELCDVGATAEQVASFPERWGEQFPRATLTPRAMRTHWSRLAEAQVDEPADEIPRHKRWSTSIQEEPDSAYSTLELEELKAEEARMRAAG